MKILFLFLLIIPNLCSGAIVFDGASTANLSCGTSNSLLMYNAAQSVCFWLYPTGAGGGTAGRFLDKETVTVAGVSYTQIPTNAIGLSVAGTPTTLARKSSNSSITLNTWQSVCYTWDGSTTATNAHIYVNNIETGYQTTTNGSGLINNSGETIFIGNRNDGIRTANGYEQDIMVWDEVISANQLTQYYNGGKQGVNGLLIDPGHLKAWWRLNECANGAICSGSNQFKDISGNGNNCTAANSPKGFSPIYSQNTGSTLYASTIY